MKKNTKIIFGVVIFVAAAIIVVSFFYPPVDEGTSGTIGKVKKYNAGQISEKDVKLKNAMLKDETTLKLSIVQLEDYKNFLGDISVDLGSWNKKINDLIGKDITVVKRSEILMENSKTFGEYKNYLDKNMGTLDKTIAMLTKLHKKDTVNQNLEIEKNLNDYENFRIQVAQRFMKMIEAIPNAHNALLLNKQPGIISNKDNLTGIAVANKDGSLSSTAQNSVFNSANMILKVFDRAAHGQLAMNLDLGKVDDHVRIQDPPVDLQRFDCVARCQFDFTRPIQIPQFNSQLLDFRDQSAIPRHCFDGTPGGTVANGHPGPQGKKAFRHRQNKGRVGNRGFRRWPGHDEIGFQQDRLAWSDKRFQPSQGSERFPNGGLKATGLVIRATRKTYPAVLHSCTPDNRRTKESSFRPGSGVNPWNAQGSLVLEMEAV